ncbi:MAG: glycosyl hydrolase, partial [Fulvivirga sp.]
MQKTKAPITFVLFSILLLFSYHSNAQTSNRLTETAKGLKLRSIGPAVMGGRIADIAVNPEDNSTWFVAVGSGGLWKTTNSGITWTPVFDAQSSYSIGTVTIDPNNPKIVWVGTGENVSGRHVGWGDGVYKSTDGGSTWKNMGLKKSEHIGKILIDPRNSNVAFVAAEGPLWSSGGERGLYKTKDGGKTWQRTLQIDENTGVTDIEFDPSDPNTLYAAAYQRRRHTWSLLAGGPKSGIYKSTDNGDTWKQVTTGLPKADIGKIGLAVTEADPQLVYATIESDNKNKGFYRSTDKGESWTKQNSYTSGGTGPHYYQEIEASPQNPDLVYQMDVFLHVTRDGGKHFNYLGTGREKHSDNHALWIDPKNGNHLIAGTDGGLYESYDEGTTWRHFPNLPISQFYKLSLDNFEPFYNVVAGAQDLGTLIGPSRTMNVEGVRNQDWYVPLGADGYEVAFDP